MLEDDRIENLPSRERSRTDNQLRAAINRLQDLLFDPQAHSAIYQTAAELLQKLTGGDFCGLMVVGGSETISANQPQNLQVYLGHQTQNRFGCTINSNKIALWIAENHNKLAPHFISTPIDAKYLAFISAPVKPSSIATVPIVGFDCIKAVCIVVKFSGVFTSQSLSRVSPLLGATACSITSSNSVRGKPVTFRESQTNNQLLSSLFHTSPIATLIIDRQLTIVHCNPAGSSLFGTTSKNRNLNQPLNLVGTNIKTYLPDIDDIFNWSKQKDKFCEHSPLPTHLNVTQQCGINTEGKSFSVSVSAFRYQFENKRYIVIQAQDFTTRNQQVDAYSQLKLELDTLTHLVPVGILKLDDKLNCLYGNDKWYELSGLTEDECQGTNWINALSRTDVEQTLLLLRDSLTDGNDFRVQLQITTPLGDTRWAELNTQALFNSKGKTLGFLATFSDITETKLTQDRLQRAAEYDELTGLANRHLFYDRLTQAFLASKRNDHIITLFFLDLDGFKYVNDTLGHSAGDLLLKEVSIRLTNILRETDTVARFGGDEFVILFYGSSMPDNIEEIASKIILNISKPYSLQAQEAHITVSLGIASGNHQTSNPESLLKQADSALYLAKSSGKNTFKYFDNRLDKLAKARNLLDHQLRHACKNQKFHLVFQPQFELQSHNIIGFEALLRFTDDHGKVAVPEDFISILEENGMIIEVGSWVIQESCRHFSAWLSRSQAPDRCCMSINVSPKQLLNESIVTTIQQAISTYSIPANQLIFEITETVIIDRPQKVEAITAKLKDIGVLLALDDFGTGFSSLSLLQKLPFDHIKIDKSFVSNLPKNENDVKITKSIIALAKSLGLKITAEGVTDNETYHLLKHYGAHYGQGFYLGKPQRADYIASHYPI